MGAVLLASILIRLAGLGLTLWFFRRDRRWPILLLTALIGLMAARQILTLAQLDSPWLGGSWPSELPGLAVSVLALGFVVVFTRLLREDVHQYFFWTNVPRETGFVFADLDPDRTVRRVTANIADLVGYTKGWLERRPFRQLVHADSPHADLPPPDALSDEGDRSFHFLLQSAGGRPVPARVFVRFLHTPVFGRRHYSLVIADRSEEAEARQLQETIADLARDAETIIANEGWGLVHIAEQAAESLDVARVNIWWFSPDHRFLRCAENYDRRTGTHTAGEVLDAADFPSYIQALESERTLAMDDPANDPRAAELNAHYLPAHGITAILDAPLLIEGQLAGVVCFEETGSPRRWNEQELAFAGSIADLVALARTAGRHRARAERLAQQAHLDPLTGLMNWQYLQDRLNQEVAEAHTGGPSLALLYIDLDRFLYLNDTLGHSAGDRILVDVAKALVAVQPTDALLSRAGGDEFVLIARNLGPQEAEALAERVRQHLADFTSGKGEEQVSLSASIGVAVLDDTTMEAGDLLAGADLACSQAKEAGRNRVAVYRPSEAPEALMSERLAMFHRIRRALSEDGFGLLFQPIVALDGDRGEIYEVLLSLRDGGVAMGPAEFLPVAERFSLMGEVDRWVVRQAIAQLARWRWQRPGLTLSINLSARAFGDQALFQEIRDLMEHNRLAPAALVFEITETEAIANLAQAKDMIWTLRELGCRFALDDFGSGFASFTYLRELPVDMVKIDGKFIRELATSSLDHAIVRALVDIAHALGKTVVAEMVEDRATLEQLGQLGVHYGQGFYLGRPAEEPAPAATAVTG